MKVLLRITILLFGFANTLLCDANADSGAAASSVPSTSPLNAATSPSGTKTVSTNTTVTPIKITIKRFVVNDHPKFYKIDPAKDAADTSIPYVAPVDTEMVVRTVINGKLRVLMTKVGTQGVNKADSTLGGNKIVAADTEYEVDGQMSPQDIVQDSLITGILVVPFKYHFSDHNISANNTTIGYYFGWEYDTSRNYFSLPTKTDLIFSFGLTPISVPAQTGTQNGNTNLLGLTLALGAGFSVADQMKVLFVCGKDWAKTYTYNAAPWCMAGIGYALQ